MGLFGQSTPFDADIEKATSETNTNENWSLILDVCDKVSSNPRNAKECLKAVMKRMGHTDPHVVMQAITLLDACVNNCGKPFHLEIASRDFENEFRRLLGKAQPKVSLKMRQVLKSWAENNDFKDDAELNLIPSLYNKLRSEGYDFSNLNEKPPKSAAKLCALKDPNVVSSKQEEDDIAKAIELSLKETKGSPKQQSSSNGGGGNNSAAGGNGTSATTAYPSLYPSFSGSGSMASITSMGGNSNNSANSQPEPRKVRALYDFEAAEENELTFFSGEIIHVQDDSDPNWWKGFNQRGEGLFPSNFVTADLSVDPERLDINQQNKTKKSVQFEDDAKELQLKTEAAAAAVAEQRVEIDETKIDRLLHLLHEANPEDPSQDTEEMLRLEQEVHQMGPLIDAELERVDRKHAQLTQLSSDLVDAINLYHSLMRDDRASMLSGAGASYMSGMAMPGLGYQGSPNPQMLYGAAGYSGGVNTHFPTSQNFSMHSVPYTNTGPLPGVPPQAPAATPATIHNSAMPSSIGSTAPGSMYPTAMPTVPMQFQNGHMNPAQINGGANPINVVGPQSLTSMTYTNMGPLPAAASKNDNSQLPSAMQMGGGVYHPHPNTQISQIGNMVQQPMSLPMQHSHQQQNQYALNGHSNAPQMNDGMNVLPPDQQQQQQPQPHLQQHQQHPQLQYTAQPQTFVASPPPTTTGGSIAAGMMQPSMHNPHAPMQGNVNGGVAMGMPMGVGSGVEQYSQLQQQIAAMSLGAVNQPVTQNFLVQNDPKNNIPIYQQQR